MRITVDGPAGAGKGTISKAFSILYKYTYVDAGAIFRACALLYAEKHILDCKQIIDIVRSGCLTYQWNGEVAFTLNGTKIPKEALANPSIATATSQLASEPAMHEILCETVRIIAARYTKIVCDGRNTGSTIFPLADHKFYVTAALKIRAARRHADLCRLGFTSKIEQVLAEMSDRDRRDQERSIAPLIVPRDAYIIDTSELSIDESVDLMRSKIGL
jgi:CMP/dCMP kinase